VRARFDGPRLTRLAGSIAGSIRGGHCRSWAVAESRFTLKSGRWRNVGGRHGEAGKTAIHRFESGRRLHSLRGRERAGAGRPPQRHETGARSDAVPGQE
jgi:hypothetical protein